MRKGILVLVLILMAGSAGVYLNLIHLPIERTIEPCYAVNLEDDRTLVGASHHVLVVKLQRKVTNIDSIEPPLTVFEAFVIHNIKGTLEGTIEIAQQIGYRHGIFYSVGDDIPMEVGATYLIAARVSAEGDWIIINEHPNGKTLIRADDALSTAALKELVLRNERVKALEAAYPEEILLDADVLRGMTYNRYGE